jgi:hypothetical protein
MSPDSDEYYCYQWRGRMQWGCVRDATGRDCNLVLVRSSGRIVAGQVESWGGISTVHMRSKYLVLGGRLILIVSSKVLCPSNLRFVVFVLQ